MTLRPIALTCGEPAGIGPDIIIQLAQSELLDELVCIGDAELLEQRAALMGLPLRLLDESDSLTGMGQLRIRHQGLPQPNVSGEPSTKNAEAVLHTLDTAIDGCLDGTFRAMTTGPLHSHHQRGWYSLLRAHRVLGRENRCANTGFLGQVLGVP